MLHFRRANAEDVPALTALIRARGEWLEERGLSGAGWIESAPGLAAMAKDRPVWVLTHERDGVIATTALYEGAPDWLWTEPEEHTGPTVFLASSVTHPAYAGQRLGCLLIWAALDQAAKQEAMWVRRGTFVPALVRYYRDVQRFREVRTVDRDGQLVTGLERRAAPQPQLTEWLSAGALAPDAVPA